MLKPDGGSSRKQIEKEYDRLRSLAFKEGSKRSNCIDRSHKARRSNNRILAQRLAEKGKKHEKKKKRYNRLARDFIFKSHNPRQPLNVIDLHGLYVSEAEKLLLRGMSRAKARGEERMIVIVGRGNHSVDRVPKIKPAVEKICDDRGLKCIKDRNEGKVVVLLEDYEPEDVSDSSDSDAGADCMDEDSDDELPDLVPIVISDAYQLSRSPSYSSVEDDTVPLVPLPVIRSLFSQLPQASPPKIRRPLPAPNIAQSYAELPLSLRVAPLQLSTRTIKPHASPSEPSRTTQSLLQPLSQASSLAHQLPVLNAAQSQIKPSSLLRLTPTQPCGCTFHSASPPPLRTKPLQVSTITTQNNKLPSPHSICPFPDRAQQPSPSQARQPPVPPLPPIPSTQTHTAHPTAHPPLLHLTQTSLSPTRTIQSPRYSAVPPPPTTRPLPQYYQTSHTIAPSAHLSYTIPSAPLRLTLTPSQTHPAAAPPPPPPRAALPIRPQAYNYHQHDYGHGGGGGRMESGDQFTCIHCLGLSAIILFTAVVVLSFYFVLRSAY